MNKAITTILILLVFYSCDNSESNRTKKNLNDQLLSDIYISELKERSKVYNLNLYNTFSDSLKTFAEPIRQRTVVSINAIENMKDALINNCGGRNAEYYPNNPYSTECVYEVMVKNEEGKKLKTVLNQFTNELNQISSENYFALDAKDIQIFRNIPSFEQKEFHEYNFESTDLITSLIRLSIFQLYILNAESRFLGKAGCGM